MTAKTIVMETDELYQTAAKLFVRIAATSATKRGAFCVALSGGSTPKRLYSLLASQYSGAIPWENTHIFFSDERCVPPEDPESNFGMVRDSLLSRVPIRNENVHRIQGELDPLLGAERYSEVISQLFEHAPGQPPAFDLILLGMGEDGHTASIFPGSPLVHESDRLVAETFVEKLGAYRITLNPSVLTHARNVVFLVTGEEKSEALQLALKGEYDPDRCPTHILRQAEGKVTWLVDPAAASKLFSRSD